MATMFKTITSTWKNHLALITLSIFLLNVSNTLFAGTYNGFFQRSGQIILDGKGEPFLMRCMGLSNWWAPEAYALGLQSSQYLNSFTEMQKRIKELLGNDDAKEFWDTYNENFLKERDIAELASLGFNIIRIPINYRMLTPLNNSGEYLEEDFTLLDKVIDWCKKNGLYVILDLHSAPGGQSHEPHSDPEFVTDGGKTGVAVLWEFNQEYNDATGRTPEFNKQRTIDLWQEIAKRYKNETAILGYELLNETFLPYGIHGTVLRDLFVRITDAIREVDKNHLILIEGNFFAGTFDYMVPPFDENMALIFHKYWRPPNYSEIKQYVDVAKEYDLPLIMGESGENSNIWYYEFKELLEANNIGFCWWGYKSVDSIKSMYRVPLTSDYQYVIDNFREYDSFVDKERFKKGLMSLASNVDSENSIFNKGFVASLLSSDFNQQNKAFIDQTLPGTIYAINYDIGNQEVAYFDHGYLMQIGANEFWNQGWSWRNDAVDIEKNVDSDQGYNVAYTENGEWLKYTINIDHDGFYELSYRVATYGGEIQFFLDEEIELTEIIGIPSTGGFWSWQTKEHNSKIDLPSGQHTITLKFITGGINIDWFKFTATSSEGSNGGGGCAINPHVDFDPTLIFLVVGAIGYIVYRRRRKQSAV
jgi:aryl-phospho-beta-D-glucosidase BglC (GH1 family)